ncbi:MAG TPA: hypothetical protein VFG43_03380 [Geminicoccaceae bacterium]|nr:hypothetical protein [Geminicoccaceae bacterium]
MRAEFRAWNARVLANAQALARALGDQGLRLVSGGTDTDLMLVDLGPLGVTDARAAGALEAAGLACNKNVIPFDPLPAETASGIRLSGNAGTTRGFGPAEFERIGAMVGRIVAACRSGGPGLDAETAAVRAEVRRLCRGFPIYPGVCPGAP